MNRTPAIVFAASAAFGLATVAACGGTSSSTNTAADGGAPTASQQTTGASDPNQVKLTATTVGSLGQVVTNGAGMTLYLYTKDTTSPPVSNCDGACAQEWPPLLATSSTATIDGIDQSLIGTLKRADGTKQITINGWAVYTYAKDTGPGDAKGQGVGKVWYAITPRGKKATGGTTATSSASSTGY
jgi:predicted lipoprotein with Yx(FWY)xxD motif